MPRPASTSDERAERLGAEAGDQARTGHDDGAGGTTYGVELLDDDVLVGVGAPPATGSVAGSAALGGGGRRRLAAVAPRARGRPAAVVSSGSGEPAALSGLSCDMSILS